MMLAIACGGRGPLNREERNSTLLGKLLLSPQSAILSLFSASLSAPIVTLFLRCQSSDITASRMRSYRLAPRSSAIFYGQAQLQAHIGRLGMFDAYAMPSFENVGWILVQVHLDSMATMTGDSVAADYT